MQYYTQQLDWILRTDPGIGELNLILKIGPGIDGLTLSTALTSAPRPSSFSMKSAELFLAASIKSVDPFFESMNDAMHSNKNYNNVSLLCALDYSDEMLHSTIDCSAVYKYHLLY
jgi:hypothetical protein